MKHIISLLLLVALVVLAWVSWRGLQVEIAPRLPSPVLPSLPKLPDLPRPRKPCPGPWCPKEGERVEAKVGGGIAPDGVTEIHCDLPGHQQHANIAARGLGCCVFRSLDHASRWQNVPALIEMPEWMVKSGIAGGGWPAKVDQLVPKIARDRGLPTPQYVQIENSRDLSPLKAACAAGRMVSVTYERSPTGRYGGSKIAHMVNMVHCDDAWVGILDNNYVGEDKIEWMTPSEFLKVTNPNGYWAVVLLAPPPPPPPRNR